MPGAGLSTSAKLISPTRRPNSRAIGLPSPTASACAAGILGGHILYVDRMRVSGSRVAVVVITAPPTAAYASRSSGSFGSKTLQYSCCPAPWNSTTMSTSRHERLPSASVGCAPAQCVRSFALIRATTSSKTRGKRSATQPWVPFSNVTG